MLALTRLHPVAFRPSSPSVTVAVAVHLPPSPSPSPFLSVAASVGGRRSPSPSPTVSVALRRPPSPSPFVALRLRSSPFVAVRLRSSPFVSLRRRSSPSVSVAVAFVSVAASVAASVGQQIDLIVQLDGPPVHLHNTDYHNLETKPPERRLHRTPLDLRLSSSLGEEAEGWILKIG
ncbi:hypothetical protein Ccrd_024775 [Cynara cardunculus var. scolymus]|uniref:Uncharacterized protein n=1 Tax=Cynara cardunculus var. scolymus TaxID=59895 RepID=A0A124SAM2_CYNCS|nr:hypothetical protein Ccrd_024775 [Cynara cardunculus var. scolymus]